jgi:DUF1365 family protein
MHSAIFSGQVNHWRKSPVDHTFKYRVFMMYMDLSELDEVFTGRWFWSTRRSALARFRRSMYLGDPNVPLESSVRELVLERTGIRPSGPIRLLTNLSYFGYCFNPVSVYYCFDERDERVEAIVAEVSNTPWGERCCYVLSAGENTGDGRTHRYKTDKELHVSPFMHMNISYDWLLTEPGKDLVVRIDNWSDEGRLFGASLNLKRKAINGPELASVLVRFPFMTLKVMAGIHWQALRLWLKGCPLVAHPNKKSPLGVNQ